MAQVASIIEELDQDPARKQNVYIFPAQHTDPQAVEELLQSLFPQASGSYSSSALSSSQNQAGSQLRNRATQNQTQRTGQSGTGSMQLGSGLGGSR
jgi:hypothetical protein